MYEKQKKISATYRLCSEEKGKEQRNILNPSSEVTLTLKDVYKLYNQDLDLEWSIRIEDELVASMIEDVDTLIRYFEKEYVNAMSVRSTMYKSINFNADIENKVEQFNAAIQILNKLKNSR